MHAMFPSHCLASMCCCLGVHPYYVQQAVFTSLHQCAVLCPAASGVSEPAGDLVRAELGAWRVNTAAGEIARGALWTLNSFVPCWSICLLHVMSHYMCGSVTLGQKTALAALFT